MLFPRLNQVNDFKSEDAQCIEKYMSTAESRKNRLDHLKMGNSIILYKPGIIYVYRKDAIDLKIFYLKLTSLYN